MEPKYLQRPHAAGAALFICLTHGRYASLHGRALQPGLAQNSDFEIDARAFEAMLAEVLEDGGAHAALRLDEIIHTRFVILGDSGAFTL